MNEVARFTFFSKDFSAPNHPEAKIMEHLQFLDVVVEIANKFLSMGISTKPIIILEQGDGLHLIIEVDAKDRDVFLRLFKTMIIPAIVQFFSESSV